MQRIISKADCPRAEDVARYLLEDTGGQVILAGKVTETEDAWIVPVFSADGGQIYSGSAAAGRQTFRVIRGGVATDGTKFHDGQKVVPILFKFSKDLKLAPGTVFSASIPPGTTIDSNSVFVEYVVDEQGNLKPAPGEREEFESQGVEPCGPSWEPRSNPDSGLNGGIPHDGKFSHPEAHR
jgi:hypothetical protein